MELPELIPGDHLLYGPSGLFGRLICLKTWSPVCHVEIYTGDGMCAASRDGVGVNSYRLRTKQLLFVLRPKQPVDMNRALVWFQGVRGQAYDWKGILCFILAAKQGSPTKMFCSELGARFDRNAGLDSFAPHWDADKIAPVNFLMSPAFDIVWEVK